MEPRCSAAENLRGAGAQGRWRRFNKAAAWCHESLENQSDFQRGLRARSVVAHGLVRIMPAILKIFLILKALSAASASREFGGHLSARESLMVATLRATGFSFDRM